MFYICVIHVQLIFTIQKYQCYITSKLCLEFPDILSNFLQTFQEVVELPFLLLHGNHVDGKSVPLNPCSFLENGGPWKHIYFCRVKESLDGVLQIKILFHVNKTVRQMFITIRNISYNFIHHTESMIISIYDNINPTRFYRTIYHDSVLVDYTFCKLYQIC